MFERGVGRREAYTRHVDRVHRLSELVGFGYVEVLGVDPNDLNLHQEHLGVFIELVDAGFPVGYLPLLFRSCCLRSLSVRVDVGAVPPIP